MRTGQRGIDLIKSFEDLRLEAYRDSVGIWTIGYGHTGPEVRAGDTITARQADMLLEADLLTAERGVLDALDMYRPSEFDACVSLTFNVGVKAFKNSTLVKLHNVGNRLGASKEFPRWSKASGAELRGLLRRRFVEAALYLEDK